MNQTLQKNKLKNNLINYETTKNFHILLKNGDKKRLKTLAENSKGKTLDVGFSAVQNHYLKDAYGIDINIPVNVIPNYVDVKYLDTKNIYNYPYKTEFFDSVIAGETIEHVPNLDSFMKEINRILKLGGVLCLSTPNPQSPVEVMVHIKEWLFGYKSKPGLIGDHVHEFPTTNMITLLNIYGFKIKKVMGTYIQIPFTNIQINMNVVPLTYQTIYIAEKVNNFEE